MYTLISSVVKPFSGNGRWETIDISNIPMTKIYTDYRGAKAVLTNPYISEKVILDLEAIRTQQVGSSLTFAQFLINNGDTVLPTTTGVINTTVKYAKYADAFRAGYKVSAISPDTSPDAEIPVGMKDWLLLTKDGLNYTDFQKYCLVNVNGYFHLTEANSRGIWVIDGMKTFRASDNNRLGIISFKDLGKIKIIPITDSMIHNQPSDQEQLGIRSYIKVPGGMDGYTTMVVIGGYLHFVNQELLYKTSPDTFCIDFNNIPLIERIYQSRERIDLTTLELETSTVNPSLLSTAQLFSDTVIKKYLTLPQSFIVQIDTTELYLEYDQLAETRLPGLYISNVDPIWPIISRTGKLVNYWDVEEDGKWAITADDTLLPNYLLNTFQDYRSRPVVSDARITTQRWVNDRLSFLRICSNI
jgi:hypothetical protein